MVTECVYGYNTKQLEIFFPVGNMFKAIWLKQEGGPRVKWLEANVIT